MKRTFARLLGLPTLIVLVSVMVTLMVGRAAVAQTPDETAKRFNYLPLVADGEGIQSTLLITNVADSSNQCSLVFLANQLDANDFETHDQLSLGGAGAAVDFAEFGQPRFDSQQEWPGACARLRDARLRRARGGEGIDILERGRNRADSRHASERRDRREIQLSGDIARGREFPDRIQPA